MILLPGHWSATLRGIARRLPLILGLPLVVLLLSWLTHQPPPVTLHARLTVAIDVPPEILVPGSDEGTAAKIGEALIDDLARILPGDVFARAIADRLPADLQLSPGEAGGSLSADDRHRVMDVLVTRSIDGTTSIAKQEALAVELAVVARAIVAELEEDGGRWLALLGARGVRLTVVDGPHVARQPPPLRARLELPLRVVLAISVALGIAFALHATDPLVRDSAAASAAAGAPVLAKIPSQGSARRRLRPTRTIP